MERHRAVLVTVTYNSSTDLQRHWAHASRLPMPWVVVDNASRDDSATCARRLGAASVITLPRNVGFSAANNVGAAVLAADCYVFVNPDVTVDPHTVDALVDLAVSRQVIVAPQLVNPDGSLQENGRRDPYLSRKLSHFLGLAGSEADYQVLATGDDLIEVSWVMGAAVVVPARLFERLHGWNSAFFVYYEDADLGMRARRLGIRTFVHGGTRWKHGWARATRRSFSWRHWRLEAQSARRFYARYPRLLIPHGMVPRSMRR